MFVRKLRQPLLLKSKFTLKVAPLLKQLVLLNKRLRNLKNGDVCSNQGTRVFFLNKVSGFTWRFLMPEELTNNDF